MKEIIQTELAPAAIGPYAQAVTANSFIFTSGQLGLDPIKMNFIGNTIQEQAQQALKNLEQVLMKGGGTLDSVLKTTCFLANMDDFARFNEVYIDFFASSSPPARSCIEASRLTKNALVEIEAIAVKVR